jgi:two-component system, chemotaxis family, protein-glutamate methylesterase/glutaminase
MQRVRVISEVRIVAIGASTGGPFALQTILSALPKDFSAPVVVVQHMATGFLQGLVDWLSRSLRLRIFMPGNRERIEKGCVYMAPDGFQMRVKEGGRIELSKEGAGNGLRPSVSCLFRSVVEVYGPHAVGVLLTGMGKDGAEELKLMKDKGAVTIVQDKASSVVHGMPGAAIKLGAACHILPPDSIPPLLISLAKRTKAPGARQKEG